MILANKNICTPTMCRVHLARHWKVKDEYTKNMLVMLSDGTFHVHNRANHYHCLRAAPFPWKQGLDFHQCPHNPHSSELSDFSSYRNTYVRARTLSHV